MATVLSADALSVPSPRTAECGLPPPPLGRPPLGKVPGPIVNQVDGVGTARFAGAEQGTRGVAHAARSRRRLPAAEWSPCSSARSRCSSAAMASLRRPARRRLRRRQDQHELLLCASLTPRSSTLPVLSCLCRFRTTWIGAQLSFFQGGGVGQCTGELGRCEGRGQVQGAAAARRVPLTAAFALRYFVPRAPTMICACRMWMPFEAAQGP